MRQSKKAFELIMQSIDELIEYLNNEIKIEVESLTNQEVSTTQIVRVAVEIKVLSDRLDTLKKMQYSISQIVAQENMLQINHSYDLPIEFFEDCLKYITSQDGKGEYSCTN